MSHFTPEQLQELETRYGLVPVATLPVRDGVVHKDSMVWWREELGPEHVKASQHWDNIKEFPQVYQLTRPNTSVIYLD